MQKLSLVLIGLLCFSGCRLSRSPEELAPQQKPAAPAPIVAEEKPDPTVPAEATAPSAEAAPEEAAAPVEIASAKNSAAPESRDYFNSLTVFVAQAKSEAGKGNVTNLQSAPGPLAGANRALSLLEASLPRVWTLQDLARAQQLLAAKKSAEAAGVLGQLADRLEKAKAELPTNMKSTGATVKQAQSNITAGKAEAAASQVGDLIKQVANSTALTQIQETRANLQEAWLAAQRNQPAVVKAILEDTGSYLTKLEALLPSPPAKEGQ